MRTSASAAPHLDVVCIGNALVCGNQSFHLSLEARGKAAVLDAVRKLHVNPFADNSTASCSSCEVWHGMIMRDSAPDAVASTLKSLQAGLKAMATKWQSRLHKLLRAPVDGQYSLHGASLPRGLPTTSYADLLRRHGSPTVSLLRIELPGFEEQVVRSMLEACAGAEWLCPSVVTWRHGRLHHTESLASHAAEEPTLTGATAPAFLRNEKRLRRRG